MFYFYYKLAVSEKQSQKLKGIYRLRELNISVPFKIALKLMPLKKIRLLSMLTRPMRVTLCTSTFLVNRFFCF